MQRRIVCILAMAVAIAFCFLKSYEVTPSQATWSGWTHLAGPNNWVGNTFVANFDSICWADVFVGYKGASLTNTYDLNVYEYPDGVNPIAYAQGVPATQEHYWLKFNLTTVSGQKFTRGRTYVAKVTRPNDSINYYWAESIPGGPRDLDI